MCEQRCAWCAGGSQTRVQQDFGRGCGEDCRGAAEQHADFLVVSLSPPRVACCGGFVRSVVWWIRGTVCVNDDVFCLLVGCSLSYNQITDVGAAKIAAALPNSKLTKLL